MWRWIVANSGVGLFSLYFVGYIDRIGYLRSLFKTRYKHIPVGSLMPSMALDGLEKAPQIADAKCLNFSLSEFSRFHPLLSSAAVEEVSHLVESSMAVVVTRFALSGAFRA